MIEVLTGRLRLRSTALLNVTGVDGGRTGPSRAPLEPLGYPSDLRGRKARGRLGSPKLSQARESAVASIKARADQHAANILPIIREAQKAGATTLRAIAAALNAPGVSTARGGSWHAMSVKNLLDRPAAAQGER